MKVNKKAPKRTFGEMVADAKSRGYEEYKDAGVRVRYVCPWCLAALKAQQALGNAKLSDRACRKTARQVVRFVHSETGHEVLAHHLCGFRRYDDGKPESVVVGDVLGAAYKGMSDAVRKVRLHMDNRCKAKLANGERCSYKAKKDGLCGIHAKAANLTVITDV